MFECKGDLQDLLDVAHWVKFGTHILRTPVVTFPKNVWHVVLLIVLYPKLYLFDCLVLKTQDSSRIIGMGEHQDLLLTTTTQQLTRIRVFSFSQCGDVTFQ